MQDSPLLNQSTAADEISEPVQTVNEIFFNFRFWLILFHFFVYLFQERFNADDFLNDCDRGYDDMIAQGSPVYDPRDEYDDQLK